MVETIQSTDLRRRVKAVLDQVRFRREPVIVQSYDTPQAVIIPYEEFAAYRKWQTRQAERQIWLAELQTIVAEVSARASLTEEEASALIAEARQA